MASPRPCSRRRASSRTSGVAMRTPASPAASVAARNRITESRRTLLGKLLVRTGALEVVGSASDGRDADRLAGRERGAAVARCGCVRASRGGSAVGPLLAPPFSRAADDVTHPWYARPAHPRAHTVREPSASRSSRAPKGWLMRSSVARNHSTSSSPARSSRIRRASIGTIRACAIVPVSRATVMR
jgi:hypothetical protein